MHSPKPVLDGRNVNDQWHVFFFVISSTPEAFRLNKTPYTLKSTRLDLLKYTTRFRQQI